VGKADVVKGFVGNITTGVGGGKAGGDKGGKTGGKKDKNGGNAPPPPPPTAVRRGTKSKKKKLDKYAEQDEEVLCACVCAFHSQCIMCARNCCDFI